MAINGRNWGIGMEILAPDEGKAPRKLVEQETPIGQLDKAGELIEIDRSAMSLLDGKIFNILMAHAMQHKAINRVNSIPKRELMTSGHNSTDELRDSLKNLQRTRYLFVLNGRASQR